MAPSCRHTEESQNISTSFPTFLRDRCHRCAYDVNLPLNIPINRSLESGKVGRKVEHEVVGEDAEALLVELRWEARNDWLAYLCSGIQVGIGDHLHERGRLREGQTQSDRTGLDMYVQRAA